MPVLNSSTIDAINTALARPLLGGPSSVIRSLDDCAAHREAAPTFFEYCERMFDRRKVPFLEQVLARCVWAPHAQQLSFFKHGTRQTAYEFIVPDTVRTERCTVGTWSVFRTGPLRTTGGDDWSAAIMLRALDPTYGAARKISISQYLLGSSLATGELVGYPPIHQHHFHLEESGSPPFGAIVGHGDDQCLDAEGGLNCAIQTMPDGYATFARVPLDVYHEFNDVRPANSPALHTYSTVALQLTKAGSAPSRPFEQSRRACRPVHAHSCAAVTVAFVR